jgi:hypothetical protein
LPEKVDSDSNEKKSFVTAAELGRFTAFAEKRAALDPAIANALGLGGAGAVLGGGIGALSGLISPQKEDESEESNNYDYLSKAFTRGLTGAAIGGGLGGLAGGFGTEGVRLLAPKFMQNDIDRISKQPFSLQKTKDLAEAYAKKILYENSSRAGQHNMLKSHKPTEFLYSNIFSDAANRGVNWFNAALKEKPTLINGVPIVKKQPDPRYTQTSGGTTITSHVHPLR